MGGGDASFLEWLGALPRLGSEMAGRQGAASEVTGGSALIATCFGNVFGKWRAAHPVTRGTSCPGVTFVCPRLVCGLLMGWSPCEVGDQLTWDRPLSVPGGCEALGVVGDPEGGMNPVIV